jgi:hypothetical protein
MKIDAIDSCESLVWHGKKNMMIIVMNVLL